MGFAALKKIRGGQPSKAINHRGGPFTRAWAPSFDIARLRSAPVAPQFELEVGAADDAYEREADAVADAVVSGSYLEQLSNGASGIQRACASCEAESDEEIRRSPSKPGGTTPSPGGDMSAQVSSARAKGGAALGGSQRSYFESRFNADFSGVRVHQGTQASSLSKGLGARAFTVGQDIFFGSGQLDYGSARGRHLMAHELTHTIQQTGALERKRDE